MHFQVDNSVVHPQKYIFWESACIFLYCKPLCTSALWNTSKFFSLQGGWRRRIVAQSTITSLQCTPHSHHRLLLRFTVYYISLAVLQCLVSVVLLAGFFHGNLCHFRKNRLQFFHLIGGFSNEQNANWANSFDEHNLQHMKTHSGKLHLNPTVYDETTAHERLDTKIPQAATLKLCSAFKYTLNSEPKALTGDKSESIKSRGAAEAFIRGFSPS